MVMMHRFTWVQAGGSVRDKAPFWRCYLTEYCAETLCAIALLPLSLVRSVSVKHTSFGWQKERKTVRLGGFFVQSNRLSTFVGFLQLAVITSGLGAGIDRPWPISTQIYFYASVLLKMTAATKTTKMWSTVTSKKYIWSVLTLSDWECPVFDDEEKLNSV